jgi:4'-phosphopantetheinyl transferase
MSAHGGLILLYVADAEPWPQGRFAAALAALPGFMREEVLALHRWQDRQARVLGRLLLRAGLARLGQAGPAGLTGLESWERGPSGRPRLAGWAGDFSISHTAGLVVCALSLAGRVGVDVENLRLTGLEELGLAFGAEEWRAIQAAPEPARALLLSWTAKEAALKADGRGLSVEPAEVDGRGEIVWVRGAAWRVTGVEVGPGFICALATDGAPPEPSSWEMRPVDLWP